jgi:hypothetical protein
MGDTFADFTFAAITFVGVMFEQAFHLPGNFPIARKFELQIGLPGNC